MVGRLTGALVSGEPDGLENPQRRTVVGLIIGLLVAAVTVGGFAAFGFIRPGGSSAWARPGVMVVEKETGTRYAFLKGRLHPVLNYASFLLMSEKPPAAVQVSRRSMQGVPHGQPIGIVGAPDALPAAGSIGRLPWRSCAQASTDQTGAVATTTTLAVGTGAVAWAAPLGPGEAIVVRVLGGDLFLVWNGRRHRIGDDWIARVLGYDRPSLVVDTRWLDSLPVGSDIAPIAVPRRGEPGPSVDGQETRIGQLFVAQAGASSMTYLLRDDGFSPLTTFETAIVAGDPRTIELYPERTISRRELSPAAVGQMVRSPQVVSGKDLPQSPPGVASAPAAAAWCTVQSPGQPRVEVVAAPPMTARDALPDGLGVTRSERNAAAVVIQPGQGGLVRAGTPGQAAGPDLFLITDAGLKYPVADATAAARLGHPSSTATAVPRTLLELLPSGPTLSRSAVGR